MIVKTLSKTDNKTNLIHVIFDWCFVQYLLLFIILINLFGRFKIEKGDEECVKATTTRP